MIVGLKYLTIVFPTLVLNYFGQGALLMVHPEAAGHPFYAMVPGFHWLLGLPFLH
jgi:KUP system potassium uptake protein